MQETAKSPQGITTITTATTTTWRGNEGRGTSSVAHLQSATTSLEAFSTSLNCVGDEIFTVLDMLGGGASECCCSKGNRECPATAAAGSDGAKHKSKAIPTSASG